MYNITSMSKGGNKGFTVVETLIVLAIAATIIIVVLLAVPSLQRQSRNTAAKVAAGAIASGWTAEVGNANGGAVAVSTSLNIIYLNNAPYSSNKGISVFTATGSSSTVVKYGAQAISGSGTDAISSNTVVLYTGVTCPSPNTGSSIALGTGTSTQAAIVYSIEPARVGCVQG